MRTTKLIFTICLVIFCQVTFGQVYQLMPQYGYQAPRMAFDSTIQIPTFCGVPTLKSVQFVNKKGAIAFDSCNNRFYTYNPKTLSWSQVSGGGGSTDTTSLSNRINLKIDSIKRRRDSVFAYRNGSEVFQFKDSIGGGGSVPTLNQVLAAGNSATDKNMFLNDGDLGHQISLLVDQLTPTIQITSNNAVTNSLVLQSNNSNNLSAITSVIDDNINPTIQQSLVLGTSNGSVFMPYTNPNNSDTLATLFDLRNTTGGNDTTKVPYTGATKDVNIGTHDIYTNKVFLYDEPNDNYSSIHYSDGDFHIEDADNNKLLVIENGFIQLHLNDTIQSNIWTTNLTQTRDHFLPNASGTIALLSDTTSLSNRINAKFSTTDTSSLQQKSVPANSIVGNNTFQQANAESIFFKDTSGVYTGSPTWNGTAPTISSHTYRWTRIGKMVTLNISLVYSLPGLANSTLNIPLPTDCPTPVEPTGLTANSSFLYPVVIKLFASFTALASLTERASLRKNSGGTGYEINAVFAGTASVGALVTLTYYTN